jgi:hypothetical protein
VEIRIGEIKGVSKRGQTGVIVSVAVTFLCLVFAIYASCCGKKCARAVLAVCFMFFSLVALSLAIIVWTEQKGILKLIGRLWDDPGFAPFRDRFESKFGCEGWDEPSNSTASDVPPEETSCESVISLFLRRFADVIGSTALALAILVAIGAGVALCGACEKSIQGSDSAQYTPLVTQQVKEEI